MKSWMVLLLLFTGALAQAEYRVFHLKITNSKGELVREAIVPLDPEQYRGYYPVHEGENVSYTDTWMCRGRTNERPACSNPREPAATTP